MVTSVDNPSNPGIIQVHIKASKTDPFCNGVDIIICWKDWSDGFRFQDNSPLRANLLQNFVTFWVLIAVCTLTIASVLELPPWLPQWSRRFETLGAAGYIHYASLGGRTSSLGQYLVPISPVVPPSLGKIGCYFAGAYITFPRHNYTV